MFRLQNVEGSICKKDRLDFVKYNRMKFRNCGYNLYYMEYSDFDNLQDYKVLEGYQIYEVRSKNFIENIACMQDLQIFVQEVEVMLLIWYLRYKVVI